MSDAQSTTRHLSAAQHEATTLRKKLTELQNVQAVINGDSLFMLAFWIPCLPLLNPTDLEQTPCPHSRNPVASCF